MYTYHICCAALHDHAQMNSINLVDPNFFKQPSKTALKQMNILLYVRKIFLNFIADLRALAKNPSAILLVDHYTAYP